jgi:plasmid stabilization system protein ParE
MKLEYHPSTATELNRAIKFYEGQRPGLGAECRAEIYAAIERAQQSPKRYRIIGEDIYRCFVRRFPFSILYRVIDDEVVRILVIRHHRQRQSYGQSRK